MKIDLSNTCYVFYVNNSYQQLRLANLTDRTSVDNNGYPWYEGCFGNCLITLRGKFTDKLYLLSKTSVKKMFKAGNFHTPEIQPRVDLLEKYADKIITREDLNNLSY